MIVTEVPAGSSVRTLATKICGRCLGRFDLALVRPKMPFLDEDGLDVLAGSCERFTAAGLAVVIVCERPALSRLLAAARLDDGMKLVSSFDEAALGPRTPFSCRHGESEEDA